MTIDSERYDSIGVQSNIRWTRTPGQINVPADISQAYGLTRFIA